MSIKYGELNSTVAGWLRAPALHFLIIGGLLSGVNYAWQARRTPQDGVPARVPIVISARQFSQLRDDFERKWHARPTSLQLQGLVQQTVDDELLYREARRLRLDLQDRSVRLRLVQKMRALGDPSQDEEALVRQARKLGLDDDVVIRGILKHKLLLLIQEDPRSAPITDAEIVAYVRHNRDRFVQPPTVTFSQVFLSATVHDAHLDEDAKTMLARLRSESISPETAAGLSDPFVLGPDLNSQTQSRLARFFGADFAESVFKAEPKTWTGPIASSLGLHLVWVSEKTPEEMLPIEAVRRQVASEISEERAQARFASALHRLRASYQVRIERTDYATARDTSGNRR